MVSYIITQGASKEAGAAYREMAESEAHKNPLAWSKPEFSLVPYGRAKPLSEGSANVSRTN